MTKLLVVFLFVAFLLAGVFWALMPILAPPQGLHPTHWTKADLILERSKFCVVNPRKLDVPEDDIWIEWTISEIKARSLIVIVPWALAIGVTVWTRRKQKKANKQMEDIVA